MFENFGLRRPATQPCRVHLIANGGFFDHRAQAPFGENQPLQANRTPVYLYCGRTSYLLAARTLTAAGTARTVPPPCVAEISGRARGSGRRRRFCRTALP